jgi:hypothetical protein
MSDEESRIEWWVYFLSPFLFLVLSISAIIREGVFGSPISFTMSVLGLGAIAVIYGSIRELLHEEGASHEASREDKETSLEAFLEPWKADSSYAAVIYRWMTVAFTIIFGLPESLKSESTQLSVLLFAGIAVWLRTGGEGIADETTTLKRIGAAVAGIVTGWGLAYAGWFLMDTVLA